MLSENTVVDPMSEEVDSVGVVDTNVFDVSRENCCLLHVSELFFRMDSVSDEIGVRHFQFTTFEAAVDGMSFSILW
jgi:hypothetical protein